MTGALKTSDGRMHDRMPATGGLIALIAGAAIAVYVMVYVLTTAILRVVPGH